MQYKIGLIKGVLKLKTNKKISTARHIEIIGHDGKVLYKGPLNAFPIPERIIIEKSIKYFDDPRPCHIHRSAVLNRIYSELEAALSPNGYDVIWQVEQLPENILRYLGKYKNAKIVKYYVIR